ncbi:MAG: pallilysin-related adhesin [Spirochaetia bacterium]
MHSKVFHTLYIFVSIIIVFLCIACNQAGENQEPEDSQLITQEDLLVLPNDDAQPEGEQEDNSVDYYQQEPQPKVQLASHENLVQLYDVNLDLDRIDEQILVVKSREDVESPISIIVVDFDTVRNAYIRSWEAETGSVNIRSFSVQLKDMTGDHAIEIICSGTNAENHQVMDIFRRTQSPTGIGIYYTPILNVSLDGSIEIDELERSQGYELQQSQGIAYPVSTYRSDPESDNFMDLIRTRYYWRHQAGRYIASEEEYIEGSEIEEARLQELYRSGASDFEEFLSGPWYRVSIDASNENEVGEVLFFDPSQRKVIFYSEQIQEVYTWSSTHKTIYRSVNTYLFNEELPIISRLMGVSVHSLDTIRIYVREGTEDWSAEYRLLGNSLQQSYLTETENIVPVSPIELSGMYRNESGLSIEFNYPRFTMHENGNLRRGGYVVYQVEENILELRFIRESGIIEETRNYALEYIEEEDELRIVRTLLLTPGEVTVRGIQTNLNQPIRLEQIEVLEDATDEAENSEGEG